MFDFTFEPKITRDFLLSKANQETYMSHYLGLPIKKGLFKNPLRKDNHVTCSFFIGKSGTLYFKDFATGECLSFEGVVMKQYSCNYAQALKIIAEDFGFLTKKEHTPIAIQPKYESVKQTLIQVQLKDFTESELKWWKSFGVSKKTLDHFKVYSCNTVFLNGNICAQSAQHSPIYGYYFGKKENIEQWRIYFPKRKDFRFLGNVSSKTIQGFKQLPKTGNLLVITKSMKDTMCLYELGIAACAPNSETQFIEDNILENLRQRFKHIVLLFDLDETGIKFSKKIKAKYPFIKVTLLPRCKHCKDVSDYYKAYGREETLNMIKKKLALYKAELNEKVG